MLVIDGSYGEGGGQVLRSALSLSALTGQPLRLVKIRAGRPKPGLQAQHLTAVLAAAQLCGAELKGAELGSQQLTFAPAHPPQAGEYRFDVAEQRQGGSAGATSLVLQTVLLPLAWADGPSRVSVRGGTHVPWSPPYHYLERVYLPMLDRLGILAETGIRRWGFYPQGGGEITAQVTGLSNRVLTLPSAIERGAACQLEALSASANLPPHVAARQRLRAEEVLSQARLAANWEVAEAPARSPGSTVILVATCGQALTGFSALGARGKPAEHVAEEACRDLLRWWHSGAAVDMHLADQLVLPLALSGQVTSFTTCRVTQHLLTNAWVVQHFLPVQINIEGETGQAGTVRFEPLSRNERPSS